MEKKARGKQAEPTGEELEFIYSKFLEKLSDPEVLEEMKDQPFSLRSRGFLKRRRKEFNAAKYVMLEQIKEEYSDIKQKKEKHFEQLVEIAKFILGVNAGTRYLSDNEFLLVQVKEGYATINREELISDLRDSVEAAKQEYSYMNLFNHFLTHIKADIPSFEDFDVYVESSPWELIEKLKLIVLKNEFKGKCQVCDEW